MSITVKMTAFAYKKKLISGQIWTTSMELHATTQAAERSQSHITEKLCTESVHLQIPQESCLRFFMTIGKEKDTYLRFVWPCIVSIMIQGVPLATEPGISVIILTPMNILKRNLNSTCYDVVTFLTQWGKSTANFIAISLFVVKLLKKCRVR